MQHKQVLRNEQECAFPGSSHIVASQEWETPLALSYFFCFPSLIWWRGESKQVWEVTALFSPEESVGACQEERWGLSRGRVWGTSFPGFSKESFGICLVVAPYNSRAWFIKGLVLRRKKKKKNGGEEDDDDFIAMLWVMCVDSVVNQLLWVLPQFCPSM